MFAEYSHLISEDVIHWSRGKKDVSVSMVTNKDGDTLVDYGNDKY